MRRVLSLRVVPAAIFLLCISATTHAQTASGESQSGESALVGRRVRLTVPSRSMDHAAGLLRGVDHDSLRVSFDEGSPTTTVARSEVSQLEIQMGTRRHALQGMWIGALVGAVTGAIDGYQQGDDPPGSYLEQTAGEKAGFGAVVVGLVGAGVGAIVGHQIKTDRWVVQPLPVRMSAAPGGHLRVAVGLKRAT